MKHAGTGPSGEPTLRQTSPGLQGVSPHGAGAAVFATTGFAASGDLDEQATSSKKASFIARERTGNLALVPGVGYGDRRERARR